MVYVLNKKIDIWRNRIAYLRATIRSSRCSNRLDLIGILKANTCLRFKTKKPSFFLKSLSSFINGKCSRKFDLTTLIGNINLPGKYTDPKTIPRILIVCVAHIKTTTGKDKLISSINANFDLKICLYFFDIFVGLL